MGRAWRRLLWLEQKAKVSGKEAGEVVGRLGEASGFCSDDTGNRGRLWAGVPWPHPAFRGHRLGNNAPPAQAGAAFGKQPPLCQHSPPLQVR